MAPAMQLELMLAGGVDLQMAQAASQETLP
jgi:hypothetical protein